MPCPLLFHLVTLTRSVKSQESEDLLNTIPFELFSPSISPSTKQYLEHLFPNIFKVSKSFIYLQMHNRIALKEH
jgi:hypothetical protein